MPKKNTHILAAPFPYATHLCLLPLIRFWEKQAESSSGSSSLIATQINKLVAQHPELYKEYLSISAFQKNKELVEVLLSAAYPPARWANGLFGAGAPFQMKFLFHSPRLKLLFLDANQTLQLPLGLTDEQVQAYLLQQAIHLILQRIYHEPAPLPDPLILPYTDTDTGLKRYYQLRLNTDFIFVIRKENTARPPVADLHRLLNEPVAGKLWETVLPPDNYIFRGLGLIELSDVTEPEVLSSLKYDLLTREALLQPACFEEIQLKLRTFLGDPELRLGISAIRKKRDQFISFGNKMCPSFILTEQSGLTCSGPVLPLYQKMLRKKQPLLIENINDSTLEADFKEQIKRHGLRSLLLATLQYGDETVGVLELGSPVARGLTATTLMKVDRLLPLFAVAVSRSSDELESRIQNIIKERFTGIHPVVEWKFADAAIAYLEKLDNKERADIQSIVCENVYPLYGAIDIRNSSQERNKAIQADLENHLLLAQEVLREVHAVQPFPIIEELDFLIKNNLKELREGLVPQNESDITQAIQEQVEPLLNHLSEVNPKLRPLLKKYWNTVDSKTGTVYERRRDFEQSLTTLNRAIADFLKKEEVKNQRMYPHYFELFKTDGVDYNIYIGGSLVENKTFDPVFLKNLRLWQLISMCKLVRKIEKLRPRLKMQLETTQLILIHNQPLSIRFRIDERRFDVDGAYNIRYEIIKKRIDKAEVKGTGERLTQPGKIALVYAQEKDADEYEGYLSYLVHKKLIKPDIEQLEIEALQGVIGLKAFRITVQPKKTVKKKKPRTPPGEAAPA